MNIFRAWTKIRRRIVIFGCGASGGIIDFCLYSWVMKCPSLDCYFHYAPFVGMLMDGVALAVLAALILGD